VFELERAWRFGVLLLAACDGSSHDRKVGAGRGALLRLQLRSA